MIPHGDEPNTDESEATQEPDRAATLARAARLAADVQRRQARERQELKVRHPELAEALAAMLPEHDAADDDDVHFEIIEEVGRGGMGIVYRAYQPDLDREVALKKLNPEFQRHAGTLFAEARQAARLQNPLICRVLQLVEQRDETFIVLEYIPGETLEKRVAAARSGRRGLLEPRPAHEALAEAMPPQAPGGPPRLPAPQEIAAIVGLVARVAWALEDAHRLDVVHRDLKPGNLMIQPDGTPRILDFGFAAPRLDHGFGLSGGTPAYCAPEQFADVAPDPRMDVHGLGATLYESLGLVAPFPGTRSERLAAGVRGDRPRRLEDLNRHVPEDLALVVAKAISPDPGDRYQSMRELAEDLGRWQRQEPVRAGAVRISLRFRRFMQRNRVAAVLSLAAALAGTMAITATIQAGHADRALVVAEQERVRARTASAGREFELGRALSQRGRWQEAMDAFARARVLGYHEPATILGRAECLLGLFQIGSARALIEELARRGDLGREVAARVLLLQGDRTREVRPGAQPAVDATLVRQALASDDLRPADAAYARSLLADTVTETRRELESALAIESWHRAANECLPTLLALTGHVREGLVAAREFGRIYPDDPGAVLQEAALLALQGDRSRAEALVAGHPLLDDGLGRSHLQSLIRVHEAAHRADEYLRTAFLHANLGLPPPGGKASLLSAFVSAMMLERRAQEDHGHVDLLLRFSPAVLRHWEPVVARVLEVFVWQRGKGTLAWSDEVLPENQDAFLHLLGGLAVHVETKDPALAAPRMLAAAEKDESLFPAARTSRLFAIGFARGQEALRPRALEAIERARTVPGVSATELRFLWQTARQMRALALAERIATEWRAAHPDDLHAQVACGYAALDRGQHAAAGQAAGAVLRLDPELEPAHDLMRTVRNVDATAPRDHVPTDRK